LPRKAYEWNGDPPTIEPHSRAKHRILGEYVRRYIDVMLRNPARPSLRLSLVDGFAGGGEYVDSVSGLVVPGSPQILINAVREAEAQANAERRKPVRVDATFHFVEKAPTTVAYLREVLAQRADWTREAAHVVVHQGTFEERLDAIVADIERGGLVNRALFVLDQYGYTGVPLPLIARIFSALPHAEVFLTVAVGWITAYLSDMRDAATKLGVPPETIDRICRDDEDGLNVEDPTRRPDLLAVQRLLHHVFTVDVGSCFYTPFFIVSRGSNRPYWLLHMANNVRANDVVKTLHWEVQNHFEHFGGAGLQMLGYDPNRDPELTPQMSFRFNDPSRAKMHTALLDAIPTRMRSTYSGGVRFGDFVRGVCNETPATELDLAVALRELCREGEFVKTGVKGENRAPSTMPYRDDLITFAPQRRFIF
jgi:three-Cys-motif partner protein